MNLHTDAFVITAPRTGDVGPWTPPPGELTIKVEACALCQRDTAIWTGDIARDFPAVLGHEIVGTLVDAEGESPWPMGTRVAGMGNHGLARLMRVPAWQVAPVDGEGPHLALVEPLACAINARRQDTSLPKSLAVIIGLGLLGQMIGTLLAAEGRRVVAVDPDPERRRLAESTGMHVIEPGSPALTSHIREAGAAYECSGSADTLWRVSTELPPGSTLLLVAHHHRMQRAAGELLDRWHSGGLVIRNVVPYTSDDMAGCVDAAAALPIDLTPYQLRIVDVSQTGDALDTWPQGQVFRHVVVPDR